VRKEIPLKLGGTTLAEAKRRALFGRRMPDACGAARRLTFQKPKAIVDNLLCEIIAQRAGKTVPGQRAGLSHVRFLRRECRWSVKTLLGRAKNVQILWMHLRWWRQGWCVLVSNEYSST
jgi:hypothetical protein